MEPLGSRQETRLLLFSRDGGRIFQPPRSYARVLLRAFIGTSLADGKLPAFLGMSWDERLKALVDVGQPDTQKLYSDLKRIKERVRNPFAHGGVENDGGSLFVHIPTLGAMPANFTRIRDSVRFNFIPVDKDDHGLACDVFDKFETMLRDGELAAAYSLVERGIDPSFAAEQLATYRELTEGDAEDRERWCEHWHHENDRHDNIDY